MRPWMSSRPFRIGSVAIGVAVAGLGVYWIVDALLRPAAVSEALFVGGLVAIVAGLLLLAAGLRAAVVASASREAAVPTSAKEEQEPLAEGSTARYRITTDVLGRWAVEPGARTPLVGASPPAMLLKVSREDKQSLRKLRRSLADLGGRGIRLMLLEPRQGDALGDVVHMSGAGQAVPTGVPQPPWELVNRMNVGTKSPWWPVAIATTLSTDAAASARKLRHVVTVVSTDDSQIT